ncbi:hypothetical protein [Streptomyces sp. M2CJ-2]|uniref:hypothetical protein n=1 Tax=Streptomyces sp. M2CJ-2 TaxID=2803948 RepID=UPI001F34BF9C|nr:hypothetical protein [Streptomyces sp. M2CJ-2]
MTNRQLMSSHYSEPAIHEAWSLPAADTSRGYRALSWTVGSAGELAVLVVHRRYLEHNFSVKGWIGWRPKGPFDPELVTITGQEEQRTPLVNIRLRPSHLALLPDYRFLLVGGRTFPSGPGGVWMPNAVASVK